MNPFFARGLRAVRHAGAARRFGLPLAATLLAGAGVDADAAGWGGGNEQALLLENGLAALDLAQSSIASALVVSAERAERAGMDARALALELAPARRAVATEVAETTVIQPVRWEKVAEEGGWEPIARRMGMPREELDRLNPGVDLDRIAAGELLLVYRFDDTSPSQSVGNPNRGRILNGQPMPPGLHWYVRDTAQSWGTTETVANICRAISHVAGTMGPTPPVEIGDLSWRRGGRMHPHKSHRTGRDADIAYYAIDSTAMHELGHISGTRLDTARQWRLFRFWLERDLVEYIFMDRRLQRTLYQAALAAGEDQEYLDSLFQHPGGRYGSIIRHEPGHATHFHVRFRCDPSDLNCSAH